ncbi:SMP-30/gluconolactonase/LRE family protein [Litoreibacter janthinus]|uniref:Sugar lactone lactonase YvrE n=1 Tax=Litoreibacter janthinus TaxID=670154 RepID=A0A1I6G6A2_9RHOB|nr:SMP-30/gluconolactonase/LRE family protein [Litoreibacter janthinus]SFR37709.1 Sugar lactone lactonase YvrE [Litoreibacter janthinus]
MIHDDRACILGEGAFWHPELNKLFWCDIIGRRLLCDDGNEWAFDEHISAIGWITETLLIIAGETSLFTFDLGTLAKTKLVDLEADNSVTRSNDGRVDPYGGFWIGTMGKNAELDAGAIYRYYKGELRRLFAPITISNAICFSPDGGSAYFTDTYFSRVMQVALDHDGWPRGAPTRFVDLSEESLNPDGAITTDDGDVLIALWGAAKVAQYGPNGVLKGSFSMPSDHITCPALGGPDMTTLFATSALQGLSAAKRHAQPDAGKTYAIETLLRGLPAPQFIL